MEIYIAGAWIVGIIQFLSFFKGIERPGAITISADLFAVFLLGAVWGVVAGACWPVTIIIWLSSYKSPAAKEAEIERQELQRREFEMQEQQKARQREEAEAAQNRVAEQRARTLWARYYSMFDERHVSEMSGATFERFVGKLYTRLGYAVSLTTAGADQGVDLILRKDGRQIAVQAKRWTGSVGNAAVQEVIAGKLYYGCTDAIVVTNSTFSKSAVALAAKDPKISLVDGRALSLLCQQFRIYNVPEFSWDEWKKIEYVAQHYS